MGTHGKAEVQIVGVVMRRFELLMAATVDTRDEITRVSEARQGHGRPRVAALRLL
jgi:hypothetical protein